MAFHVRLRAAAQAAPRWGWWTGRRIGRIGSRSDVDSVADQATLVAKAVIGAARQGKA